MGNTNNTSGEDDCALVVVEKPLVPDLLHNESIFARVEVRDEEHVIDEWPAPPFVVDSPGSGLLRCTFWAIDEDDSNVERECGEVVLSLKCLEEYEQTAFQVWLRLMDCSRVPVSELSTEDVFEKFHASLEDSADASASKVCITVAHVSTSLISGNWSEDLFVYQRILSEHPVMKLLSHSSDILTAYYNEYISVRDELACANRDFNSKESLYHNYVVKSRKQMEEIVVRYLGNASNAAERFASLMVENILRQYFVAWRYFLQSRSKVKPTMEIQRQRGWYMMLVLRIDILRQWYDVVVASKLAAQETVSASLRQHLVDTLRKKHQEQMARMRSVEILREWRDVVVVSKQEAQEVVNESLRQHMSDMLRQKHQEQLAELRFSMVKIWSDRHESLYLRGAFFGWKDSIEDAPEAQPNQRREVADSVERIMFKLETSNSITELHTLFQRWQQLAIAARALKEKRRFELKTDAEHDILLERMFNKFGSHHETMTLHSIMREWLQWQSAERRRHAKELHERGQQLYELQRVRKTGVGSVVFRVCAAVDSVQLQVVFTCWRAWVLDAKQARRLERTRVSMDKAHSNVLRTWFCSRTRRAFLVWRQQALQVRRDAFKDMRSQLLKQADDTSSQQQQLRDQVRLLQHQLDEAGLQQHQLRDHIKSLQEQLAVVLLSAEHDLEEVTDNSLHFSSCVDELRAHCQATDSALTSMEMELEPWMWMYQSRMANGRKHRST